MGEFLDIAERLIRKHREPMTARDLIDLAIEERLFSDRLSGKTPHQTMKAKLSVDIVQHGPQSRFVRTAPGKFFLRELIHEQLRDAPIEVSTRVGIPLSGKQHMFPIELPARALPASEYEPDRQRMAPARERVMAFASELMDRHGRFQGVRTAWKRLASSLLSPLNCTYVDRLEAEEREDLKQVVTYVMVTRRDKILAFKRGTFNRVEDFLRGANCIGFGGHIAEVDRTLYNFSDGIRIARDNAVRELFEELDLPSRDRVRLGRGEGLEIVGLLNDDSSSTGRRHFAIVLHYRASTDPGWEKPLRGEKSITQLRWMNLNEPDAQLKDFEYWSQLCLAEFYAASISAQPSFLIKRKRALQPPRLLCITGGIGSGKSLATEILKRDFGYAEVNTGRVLAGLLGVPPVPDTPRAQFQRLAWKFINTSKGPTRLAHEIYKIAAASGTERILVDGVRQRATLDRLREKSGGMLGVLFVYAPPNIAFELYSQREGNSINIYDFLHAAGAPVEAEVRRLIGNADAVLYNWVGKSLYKDAILKLMANLGVERKRS